MKWDFERKFEFFKFCGFEQIVPEELEEEMYVQSGWLDGFKLRDHAQIRFEREYS